MLGNALLHESNHIPTLPRLLSQSRARRAKRTGALFFFALEPVAHGKDWNKHQGISKHLMSMLLQRKVLSKSLSIHTLPICATTWLFSSILFSRYAVTNRRTGYESPCPTPTRGSDMLKGLTGRAQKSQNYSHISIKMSWSVPSMWNVSARVGFQYKQEEITAALRGLDKEAIRCVLVCVLAERKNKRAPFLSQHPVSTSQSKITLRRYLVMIFLW